MVWIVCFRSTQSDGSLEQIGTSHCCMDPSITVPLPALVVSEFSTHGSRKKEME